MFKFICNADSVCKTVNLDGTSSFSDRIIGSLCKNPLEASDPEKMHIIHIFYLHFRGVLIHPWFSLEARLRMLGRSLLLYLPECKFMHMGSAVAFKRSFAGEAGLFSSLYIGKLRPRAGQDVEATYPGNCLLR